MCLWGTAHMYGACAHTYVQTQPRGERHKHLRGGLGRRWLVPNLGHVGLLRRPQEEISIPP